MTKYIQITKSQDAELDGNIYPVTDDYPPTKYRILGTGRTVLKSDCEEVALPQIPDGAHLITTEQLTPELKEELPSACDLLMGRGYDNVARLLEKQFPAVFAPAKTYKSSDRFSREGSSATFRIIQDRNGCINLLNEAYDLVCGLSPVQVQDVEAITAQEFSKLTALLDSSPEEFTLLPDSTALEEYNAQDSYLSEALKGGRR